MIITIIIAITITLLAIIGLIGYYLHLKNLEDKRLSETPIEEPKDNRIYLDRLQILRRRYEHIAVLGFEDNEAVPQELKDLLSLVEAITNKLY